MSEQSQYDETFSEKSFLTLNDFSFSKTLSPQNCLKRPRILFATANILESQRFPVSVLNTCRISYHLMLPVFFYVDMWVL